MDSLVVPAEVVIPDRAPGDEPERGRLVGRPLTTASGTMMRKATPSSKARASTVYRPPDSACRAGTRTPLTSVDRPGMGPARRVASHRARYVSTSPSSAHPAQVDTVHDQPQGRRGDHRATRPSDRDTSGGRSPGSSRSGLRPFGLLSSTRVADVRRTRRQNASAITGRSTSWPCHLESGGEGSFDALSSGARLRRAVPGRCPDSAGPSTTRLTYGRCWHVRSVRIGGDDLAAGGRDSARQVIRADRVLEEFDAAVGSRAH